MAERPRQITLPPTDDVGVINELASSVYGKVRMTRGDVTQPGHWGVHGIRAGGISIGRVEGIPNDMLRDPRMISQDDRSAYLLILQLSGRGRISQGGQDNPLLPGQLVLYDSSRPYRCLHRENYRRFFVTIPRERMILPPDLLEQHLARPVRTDRGLLRVTGAFLSGLCDELNSDLTGFEHHLTDAVLGLVGSALTGLHTLQERAAPLVDRVVAYIEAHLDDANLSLDLLARAHGVSPRQLHRTFAPRGETPGAYLRRRRLERLRADLANPALASLSIPTLAARWGILDARHVSRAFRAAFGSTPGEFRRAALGEMAQVPGPRTAVERSELTPA